MAIETTTSVDVKTLTPFKRFIMTLGILPTSYLESMTYAELVMWFCNFLQNEVIPAVNNNAEAVKEIQDFINTLDLQNEVDHKLDEMVESGELQEIIAEYINANALWCFDNIDDLKLASNLIAGSYAKTLGYYTVNDGGASTYYIKELEDETPDNITIILLDSGLIAILQYEKEMTPEQFGAVGDGTTDDYLSIQTAVNTVKNVKFNNKTYSISDTIYIDNYGILDGNGCIIYNTSSHPALRCDIGKHDITIKNFKIQDNNTSNNQHGIYLTGNNHIIDNCIIDGVTGDGIALGTGKNQTVKNCKILDSKRISILSFEGDNTLFENLYIHGGGHKYVCQFKSCINSTMNNITIEEGTEISCLSTIQAITENPDPVISKNNTITNIKIINHGKNWIPEDSNQVAVLVEGFNYYVSNIEIKDSYTGGIKTELTDSVVENINVNGYGLNGDNHIGATLVDATDYGDNNIMKNFIIKGGTYQGIRSHLFNSTITNIHITDCGTSSNPQFVSADENSIIDTITLTAKTVDCRGLGFAYSTYSASNSRYTNIKRIKADGFNQYDISGSTVPASLYIECIDPVRSNCGRGNLVGHPILYNKDKMTIYEMTATTGVTAKKGDVVVYDDDTKISVGYDRAYYDGTQWINIIPISS